MVEPALRRFLQLRLLPVGPLCARLPRVALLRVGLVALLALGASLSGCGSCGEVEHGAAPGAVPSVNPWMVRSDEALEIALGDAQSEATRRQRRVLLVFVGFGDADSEAVVRVLSETASQTVVSSRYVRVFINVGREGVGHARLRHAHDVRKLATLVVLEPSGRRVARQTFSPVSDGAPLSSTTLAAWLDAPRGR